MNLRNTADGALDDALERHINGLMDRALTSGATEGVIDALRKAERVYKELMKALDEL